MRESLVFNLVLIDIGTVCGGTLSVVVRRAGQRSHSGCSA